ncbi:MAG TPA: carboxypeptidase regulatory-like domain-containing protein [Pyrinomonadaceae bacterium]|nr:carboxypeptidase regulatory-like domain-containing protein [Pyrinomonadaceae bacterium]
MFFAKLKRAAASLTLLLLTQSLVFAQGAPRAGSSPRQDGALGIVEVPDTEETRRFVGEHSFDNSSFRRKQSDRAGAAAGQTPAQGARQVRVVYLVPSDRNVRADYRNEIAKAVSDVQRFYREQLGGGLAFSLHAPAVEVYQTPHAAAFYSTGNGSGSFWARVLGDGFALTGGGFNDPDNRWVFYVDADPACGQGIGGTQGVALLAANDLRGLTGQANVPVCPNDFPDTFGVNRWVGGLGHELGHTFDLPHPPGCDAGRCAGGSHAANSLMWTGYAFYPNTYLLDENKTQLLATSFFNVLSLDPSAKYAVVGRVAGGDGAPLAGATVTIDETQASVTTDANGEFGFANLPAGGNYTVGVAKEGYRFAPPSVVFNNLDRNQAAGFAATALPLLMTEENSDRAVALDSVTLTRDPFTPAAPRTHNLSADGRTRIMLFAANVNLTFGETVSALAEDSQQRLFVLPVESVGKVPGQDWLTQINVRLPDGLAGDVRVSIVVRGEFSNRALVRLAPPQ